MLSLQFGLCKSHCCTEDIGSEPLLQKMILEHMVCKILMNLNWKSFQEGMPCRRCCSDCSESIQLGMRGRRCCWNLERIYQPGKASMHLVMLLAEHFRCKMFRLDKECKNETCCFLTGATDLHMCLPGRFHIS